MKRYFWGKKLVMLAIFIFAVITPLSFIVMALWNNILVPVLQVNAIGFWQALGIFTLCRILFGGLPGRWGRGYGGHWGGPSFEKRKEMMEKWQNMTPEERQKFKQEWRKRCGHWKYGKREEDIAGKPGQEEKII
ncbi:hypothetical protein [Foetidibacter luteolus]|uniref:hypothetical protein n=1 Tax=Foetidibacter luteolus TaxID=2608880 RepID=UPI001A984CE7|nr:hypothetical protein [Foetidibacter luteolus]